MLEGSFLHILKVHVALTVHVRTVQVRWDCAKAQVECVCTGAPEASVPEEAAL